MTDHADLLRRAAARARETAQAYEPTPFELADRLDELGLNPRLPTNQAMATQMLQREQAPRQRDDKFMLAVADWLESWDGVDLTPSGPLPADYEHAANVARALLGEDTE